MTKKSEINRYQYAEKGMETSFVREMQAAYHVSKQQMAGLLGVSEKTYYTIMNEQRLDSDRSDRFLFIEKIFDEGMETFGSQENFSDWLNRPHPNLFNKKPIDLMDRITGAEAVYAEVIRTKHSILS